MRQGQTLRVLVRAADRDGRYIREGRATARIWTEDNYPYELEVHDQPAAWHAQARGYVALVDTTGWEPGTYIVVGDVHGVTDAGQAHSWSAPTAFTVAPASDS